MITYNYFSGNFQKENAHLYQLSALVGADSFGYILEDEDNNLSAIRTYDLRQSSLRESLVQDTILRLPFRETKMMLVGPVATLVPESLFDADTKEVYLGAVSNLNSEILVQHDKVKAIKAVNVFGCPTDLGALIESFFPKASIWHQHTALITGWSKEAERVQKQHVFAHVLNRHLTVAVFDKGNLLYCNSFSYNTVRDFLYYVLLVFDTLKLNPERVPLTLSGEVMPDSEVWRELYKYVRTVLFSTRPNAYRYPSDMPSGLLDHFHFDLFSLKLCAS